MNFCYAIKDWDKHFENSESRKIKSLTWVPVKNKHDGKGYRRVVAHPKGCLVFCAWCLIVQVASKMPTRGVLLDEDGPLTTSDLSFKTGAPEHIFETAFQVLTDPKVGWLVKQKCPVVPVSPEVSGGVGVEQKGMEHNGTEGNGREYSPPTKNIGEEEGLGEKPAPEIPTEDQAVAQTMTAGVVEEFARYVYRTWFSQSGKNGNGISVQWLPYVVGRWKNEGVEWRNGTHRGNRTGAGAKAGERKEIKEGLKLKTI